MESTIVPIAIFFNPFPRVPPISFEEIIAIIMTKTVGIAIMKYEALYISEKSGIIGTL